MKTERIYSPFLFSICLHSLLVGVAVIYTLYSGTHYKVKPFVISLVDTSSGSPSSTPAQETVKVSASPKEKSIHTIEKSVHIPEKTVQTTGKLTHMPEKIVHANENMGKVTTKEASEVNDRIAALEAIKKIETMQRLREVVTVSATKGTGESKALRSNSGRSRGADYLSLIGSKIHQKWVFPERTDKDLLAIIDIRIARNGDVTVMGFEKKSGNVLFDRAAIRAITSASPLPPPSTEMGIGLKFTP